MLGLTSLAAHTMKFLPEIIGYLGAITSIISFILSLSFICSDSVRRKRVIYIGYIVCFVLFMVMSTWNVNMKMRLDDITRVERAAADIIRNRDMAGDYAFIMKTLSFLETHKEKFPDTYRRALAICEVSGVLNAGIIPKGDYMREFEIKRNSANALQGIIEGIAIAERGN